MEENRELNQVAAAQPQPCRRLPMWAKLSIAGLLAVVLACIGLVSTLVVPHFVGELVRASRAKAKADIIAISDGVVRYILDHQGRFPTSLQLLLREEDGSGKQYLDVEAVPGDPWGRPYGYEPPEPGRSRFRVFTLGKDGQPGGEGEDQDIDNLLIKEGKI